MPSSSRPNLVTGLREVFQRLAPTDVEFAALSGCAAAIVRRVRRDGQLPDRAPTLRRLTEFVERARRVPDRRGLGLP
jgi:hypothetical protein